MEPSYSLRKFNLQEELNAKTTEHFFDFGEWLVLVDIVGNLVGFRRADLNTL